ncbi:MAG: ATP-grasp domain-containing protein [Bacteroidales bacterium]|nr:ATP-grasp domain-containing protein [Bacteroidales bacterium]
MILGASILQVPAIRKAKQMGYHVIAVDMDINAIGFQYADESLLISTIDTDKIVAAAVEKKIDGILTLATDMPVRGVAAVSERLGLIGISTDTAYSATDKCLMRKRLSQYNVPIPSFHKVKSIEDYHLLAKHYNFHFIVKPADNSGSRGVYLVQSKKDVSKGFRHAKEFARTGEILIEEFMTGMEISVETISCNRTVNFCAITDKITTGPPYFVETGHTQPARLDLKTIKSVKKITADAIKALGIEHGPAHTEIIITKQGPKIVEIGARLGGGFIATHLVPLSTGIDMIENSIKVAMNEIPDLEVKFDKAAAIRFFTPSRGKIKSISGIEKALSVKGVNEASLFKREGEIVNDLQSGSDRVGFVIASGTRTAEAVHACESAIDLIHVSIMDEFETDSIAS